MLVTDRFAFLHLHKSGGSFVLECLRFVPSARTVGYHLPRARLPLECHDLPVLGFVRNPWSYYVSWYHFQAQRPNPNPLFNIVSDGGRLPFEQTLRNLIGLGGDSPYFETVLAALPVDYGGAGIQLPKYAISPLRFSGLGFYSHLCRYFYGGLAGCLTIERCEDLRARLLAFLEREALDVPQAMRKFILSAPPRNASTHRPYIDYYSPELRDLVASHDRGVIQAHGYCFGTAARDVGQ
jgi:hypothetical protein